MPEARPFCAGHHIFIQHLREIDYRDNAVRIGLLVRNQTDGMAVLGALIGGHSMWIETSDETCGNGAGHPVGDYGALIAFFVVASRVPWVMRSLPENGVA